MGGRGGLRGRGAPRPGGTPALRCATLAACDGRGGPTSPAARPALAGARPELLGGVRGRKEEGR
eukprot:13845413-Alexandrium_andersonii.AAC.1